ncbi:MAG: ATP-binding cassette domain-containing protein [Opitutales bacterium]
MQAKVRDVDFTYGEEGFRLRIPKLDLESGERVAFVGPSGSGKTTLLHLLAGILIPRSGLVRVGDFELNRLDDAARRAFRISKIGFVFQDFRLIEYLNVRENALLPYRLNPSLRLDESVGKRLSLLAEQLQLGDQLDLPIDELSQGERQRAAIARALLARPGMILADEPTGNLDPANKTRILDLLFSQTEESESTLVMVTHDHALLDRFDRVIDFANFHNPEVSSV